MNIQTIGDDGPGVAVTIPNYQVVQLLGEGHDAIAYQAYRHDDPSRQALTLKVFKNIYPSPGQQARFRRELRLLQQLDSPYLARGVGLEQQGDLFILVSHYHDNLYSLQDWLTQNPFAVDTFLKIAIHLARALEDIHSQQVMHGDLKPSNILVDDSADTAKLIDFGMSRIFQRELAHYPEGLAGTLLYISPEQTGRTNKPVDYRSDFYSLGVTFFQMATGRLPFESTDRLSLIHAHLAVEPPQASAFNSTLPQPLSDLIVRLMAKNAKDRYQGAAAIRADLEHCQAEWQTHSLVKPFTLGTADRQMRFEVSRKLYGREAELQRLKEILTQLGQGPPVLVLVAGSAGIGKTMLIQALQPSIVAIRGMFVADKYDRYQRNIPYSALVRSLRTLLRHLLREPARVLQEWRESLQVAIGVNGRVITEIVPELEHLLGPQPPIPDLPPEQARGRFTMTFSQLLRALGSARQPLVLFLDDLQWADESSFDFLQTFLTDPQPAHLLILASYRDNEVGPDHRLPQLITHLTAAECPPYQVHLTPLDLPSVKQLLLDTFGNGQPAAPDQISSFDALAELLYHKSDANPFFLTTLLHTLYDNRLITYDPGSGWNWDLANIQTTSLSDDVVDLLIQRLDRLPEETLELLKQGACLGNTVPLSVLSLAGNLDLDSLYPHLEPAIQGDLIRDQGDTIRFVHGRVKEAVYSLLDEAERERRHWQNGQIMLDQYDQQTLKQQLFAVVNQLNQGRGLAEDAAMRARLVELNYRAGLKARASIAFDASLTYFQVSRELLADESWQTNYTQTYQVWYELLMANVLLLNHEAAFATADVILENSRSELDQARCYRRLVLVHHMQNNFSQAIAVSKQALSLFGQTLPEDELIRPAIGAELKYLAEHLTSQEVILDRPDMTDPAALVQVEIRHELTPSLYRTSPELFVLNNLQMIRLALKHGNHPALGIAFTGNAVAMIVQGQLKQAAFFKAIAAALFERYPTAFETAQTVVAAAWSNPILLPDLEAIRRQNRWGQTLCKNVSNMFYWAVSLANQILTELVEGRDLAKSLANAEEAEASFFRRHKIERYRKFLVTMVEGYFKPLLDLEAIDLETLEQELIDNQLIFSVFHLHIFGAMLRYTLGDYPAALKHLSRANDYIYSQPAGLINPVWQIYQALTLLALAQETPNTEYVEQAEELLAKVEALSEYTNTFKPFTAFIRAELAYTHQESTWHSSFFAAIDQAAAAGYTLLQATIHEHLAIHLLASGYRASWGHIEEARYLLTQCGATAKAQQLQQTYALYLHRMSTEDLSSISTGGSVTSSVSESLTESALHQDLDTYAILKASQAISSEIDLERVLSVITQTIGEVSGAESVYLIMEENGKRVIRARMAQAAARAGEATLVKGSRLVSEGIVRYVRRTGQTLLLDDACQVGEFTNDPYVQAKKARSVLCQPIQEQNRLVGVIYLENNLSSYAFTSERVEVVRLLASQAAISITNAQAIAARSEQERVQRELAIAHDVQRSMLPARTPAYPNFDIAAISQAAREMSGDLYGYYQRPGGELAVAVGDVSGKGMPAALLMSASVIALTGAIEADLSPSKALTRTHRVLQPHIFGQQNVAICLAYLEDKRVCLANAGVISPILRTRTDTQILLDVGGLPLGTHLSDQLPYVEKMLQLSPGDLLVLSTDGVVEATNAQNEMYGFNRFKATIASGPTDNAQAVLDYLMADLQSFVDEAEQHDDIAVVVIRMIE